MAIAGVEKAALKLSPLLTALAQLIRDSDMEAGDHFKPIHALLQHNSDVLQTLSQLDGQLERLDFSEALRSLAIIAAKVGIDIGVEG
jgi:hypothetical protein